MNELKEQILKQDREIFLFRTRIVCLFMATPLVLSFIAVDYFFKPDLIMNFLTARLFVIPTCLIALGLMRLQIIRQKYFFVPILVVITYLGLYHAYLISLSGYETSGYYAGINLALIVAISFFPWSPKHLSLPILLSMTPYSLIVLFKGNVDLSYFVPNIAFLGSTAFLGILSYLITRHLRASDIKSKMDLEKLNRVQAEIIEQKTKEGIYLEKLASQFSPQIVSAIKLGDLSLESKQRREITCIFLDVENSTGRSVRIDHSTFVKVLEEFFNDCVSIFLKHDVTIGTYLGDGLMAFTNAPQETHVHRNSAVDACIEILKSHKRKRRYFLEKWRTEFNIRVGIETGYATVGFFPSRQRGTYTALGETVNRAARFCSSAKPNSICVSKSLLLELPQIKDTKVSKIGLINNLKGFEGEQFELFAISASESEQNDMNSCSLCEGTMVIESDLGDSMMLKCQKCGYRDLVSTDEINKGSKKVS